MGVVLAWIFLLVFVLLISFALAGLVYWAIKEWETTLFIIACALLVYGGIWAIGYLLG